jgi:hypothetical protein
MELIATNQNIRTTLIQKGRERLKIFTWKNTAIDLMEVFKRTANSN